jgi:hypothetical protein
LTVWANAAPGWQRSQPAVHLVRAGLRVHLDVLVGHAVEAGGDQLRDHVVVGADARGDGDTHGSLGSL